MMGFINLFALLLLHLPHPMPPHIPHITGF
jgi:hypothetical protein